MDITTADPLIGQLFDGRYRVDARVARGGMATVYTGFDTRLDRIVAIKVMHQSLAEDDAFVARFHREAKAAARLSHPNVVAIYDQGSDGGRVFLVMEHIDGGTLRDRLRSEGRLSPAAALGVMEPVLEALAAAHDAGLVHRDVKPENILISSDGRIKVADFGLARAIETTGMTTTGLLIGTVSYLAPEQVSTGRADPRSDVYSAGIVLFELLTGAPPYDGDTPLSVAYRHVNDSVPAPSSLLVGVPREVDEVVRRATLRDPEARPATARDLLVGVRHAQLAVAAAGATTALRPIADAPTLITPLRRGRGPNPNYTRVLRAPGGGRPPIVGPVRRRRRPRRSAVALLAILLLALAVAIIGWRLGVGSGHASNSKGKSSSAASSAAQSTAPAAPTPIVTDDVRNLTFTEAKAKLEGQGFLRADKSDVFSETVAKDFVIDQTPVAKAQAKQGDVATLVVSKGPERVGVPKLVGVPKAAAIKALTDVQLAVGTQQDAFSETVAKDIVISAGKAQGDPVAPQTKIDLVVSKGKQPVPVPDVTGKAYDAAAKILSDLKLKASRTDAYSSTTALGLVVSQSPAGPLVSGDTVKLVVSKGLPPVAMPKVLGLSRREAVKRITRLGLQVILVDFPGRRGSTVIDQRPAPGVMVPAHSTVTIYLF
ncbi:MAG: Stk1 family PASTA domain-containing Ser/Thr kinase [Actinomycetota bacterium]